VPRRRLEERQPNFAAGLVEDPLAYITGVTYEQPNFLALPENALTAARGCRITSQGAVQKHHGSRRLHASAIDGVTAIRGGFSWRKGDGTVQQLVTTNNLFTGSYALPISWTSQAGALDSGKNHDFAPFRDGSGEVVYIADGGLLNKWDGTNVTVDLASTPSVTQLAVYNQRLFGITGSDQTLYWSALNNGDSLGVTGSGGGVAVVRTYGGQHLTGLAVVNGTLLIFHANAISRFTGYAQDDIDIDAGAIGHAAEVGTVAPRSIVVIDIEGRDAALFLTRRGLYIATESGVVPVPSPFDRDVQALADSDWIAVHAAHHRANREVWFNISGFLYVYQYDLKAWSGPTSGLMGSASTADQLWPAEDANGAPILLGATADGFVRHLDYPTTTLKDVLSDGTGGTATSMQAQARPWFFGDDSLEKVFRHLYLTGQALGNPVTVTVSWVTSTGDSGSTTATLPTTFATVAVPVWGRGTYLRVTVTDDTTGGATILAALRGEAFALGRRR
jgi:hypothetical protein